MLNRFLCVFAFALSLQMLASAGEPMPPKTTAPLDASFLRLYAETRGFMLGRPVKPKPTPDGKSVLFLRSEAKKAKLSLFEFDVATGKTKELLSPETVLKGAEENLSLEEKARRERMRLSTGGFADYQLSEDGKRILLGLSGKLYIFDRITEKVRSLNTGKGTLLDPKWSPDGSKVAYVLDHDVSIYDLDTDKESPVTKGGTVQKTHGLAEFVAQEEMARFSGYWWSPDSKFIAYEEAAHEGVEVWYVADPAKPEQKPLQQYYPRPGKKNVAVRLGIVPVGGGETIWAKFDSFEYLTRVDWGRGGLIYQTQSRNQQVSEVGVINPTTGQCQDRSICSVESGWLEIDPSLPKSNRFDREKAIFSSKDQVDITSQKKINGEGDHFLEIVVFNEKNTLHRMVTRLQKFLSYDENRKEIYFLGSSDPTQMHVHRAVIAKLEGEIVSEQLTKQPGQHSATFGKDHSCYALSSTSLTEMPQVSVRTSTGGKLGELPSVAIEPTFTPNVTIEKVGDGEGFYTAVIRPHHFDPKQKYPVIVDVYGGPHHLTVQKAMRPWLLMQWLADQGFIVVALDNRGTPGRGRDWERAIYQKFGSVPLEDQVKGLKLLGEKHPEMDMERVGIVGWSFGGYMSALAVLKRPDVFKAAVAGAPVTDWEDYDTHYTERYMGLLPESKKAYEEASLLPLAAKLERPLLLVHGTADDNVYFRQTLRLTDALFRAGKEFEVLPLPSLTHMVPDPIVTERLWTRIAGHFQKHLGKPK